MKKGKRIIVISAIIVLLLIISSCVIDYKRFESNQKPLFCIKTDHLNDGGTTVYYGLGYQLIEWKVVKESEEGVIIYYHGKEKNLLFNMNNIGDGPKVTLEKRED